MGGTGSETTTSGEVTVGVWAGVRVGEGGNDFWAITGGAATGVEVAVDGRTEATRSATRAEAVPRAQGLAAESVESVTSSPRVELSKVGVSATRSDGGA